VLSYNVKLNFDSIEDKNRYSKTLEFQRFTYNECSKCHFGAKTNSLVKLHNKFYKQFREKYPEIPSNIVIHTIQEVLSSYRSIKSNKHKIDKPPQKKNLSIRLTKNTSTLKVHLKTISLTAFGGKRVKASFVPYPKLQELINKYPICDPLIFERDGQFWLNLTFETPNLVIIENKSVGVDLGINRAVATSEGMLIIDKKFNGEKRRLRFNKRKLQSKNSKSAKRHLKKLRRKESNKNKNQTHLISNTILKSTNANVIVLEDLTKIKQNPKNKYKKGFNNKISQVPFYELRRILEYKAMAHGKVVKIVSPYWTSQIDSVSEKKEGERRGSRFYSKSGIIYDADLNAAINIAKRSKLPVSQTNNLTYGQAKVNSPIVGGSHLQASTALA
jgi:IS605 OrfB family transposase